MITRLVIAWTFFPQWFHPWANGGHGCPISTCITFFNMPCILGLNNHSSIIHLGVGMRFINYYIMPKSWR